MDSLTEKMVQLLVSHRVRLELRMSESLKGIGGKNTEIQSLQFHPAFTVALFPFNASV